VQACWAPVYQLGPVTATGSARLALSFHRFLPSPFFNIFHEAALPTPKWKSINLACQGAGRDIGFWVLPMQKLKQNCRRAVPRETSGVVVCPE